MNQKSKKSSTLFCASWWFFCMEQQNWSDLWDNCSVAFQNSAVNFAPCAIFQWEDFRSTNGAHRTTIDDDWLIDVCPWTMSKFRAAEMSYHQDVTVQSQGVISKIPSTQISYIYIYIRYMNVHSTNMERFYISKNSTQEDGVWHIFQL